MKMKKFISYLYCKTTSNLGFGEKIVVNSVSFVVKHDKFVIYQHYQLDVFLIIATFAQNNER